MSYGFHYTKPEYSKEQLRAWDEQYTNLANYIEKHTHETIKMYEVNGFFIKCIQTKYDSCLRNRFDRYGIQVWDCNPEETKIENPFESCIFNKWFDNPTEANDKFKQVKEMLQ